MSAKHFCTFVFINYFQIIHVEYDVKDNLARKKRQPMEKKNKDGNNNGDTNHVAQNIFSVSSKSSQILRGNIT